MSFVSISFGLGATKKTTKNLSAVNRGKPDEIKNHQTTFTVGDVNVDSNINLLETLLPLPSPPCLNTRKTNPITQ